MQNPYGKVDAQISYKLMKNKQLEIVLNISNLFNEQVLFYNNLPSYQYDAEVKMNQTSQTLDWVILFLNENI